MNVIIARTTNPETDATCYRQTQRGKGRPVRLRPRIHKQPDLVERLRTGAPLGQPDFATPYGGGAAGYTDYPTIAA